MANLPTNKETILGSVTFSLSGIRALMSDLDAIVKEQAEIEIAQAVKTDDQTDEQFAERMNAARRDAFKILATINYADGSSLHTSEPNDVKLDDGGPLIKSFFVSNFTPYKSFTGAEPEHMFQLLLDFSQPPLLDASTLVSSPTLNTSNLTVRGRRTGWRTAIDDAVEKRIKKRRAIRQAFHSGFVYDFGLLLFGLPLAFYACWYLSQTVQGVFSGTNVVVISAAYVYIGFVSVWIYRILFSYTKWAFPLVELTDQATGPARHRAIWWTLMVLIFGRVLWATLGPYLPITHWLP